MSAKQLTTPQEIFMLSSVSWFQNNNNKKNHLLISIEPETFCKSLPAIFNVINFMVFVKVYVLLCKNIVGQCILSKLHNSLSISIFFKKASSFLLTR